jgi:U4/U6.U5 tri-snRNP component SNU23
MASYKQVANVQRRTWDKEAYEKRAKDRLQQQGEEGDEGQRERLELLRARAEKEARDEFKPAEEGAQGPEGSNRAYLQTRKGNLSLDEKVGKTTTVTYNAEGKMAQGAGYYCEVCECLLRDSLAYLDHINGKRHQTKLGFSMRVSRSSVGAVKDKLQMLAAEKLKRKSGSTSANVQLSAKEEYEARIRKLESEQREKKEAQRRAREEAKKARDEEGEEGNDDSDAQGEDAASMAALMGFAGFGGSKK